MDSCQPSLPETPLIQDVNDHLNRTRKKKTECSTMKADRLAIKRKNNAKRQQICRAKKAAKRKPKAQPVIRIQRSNLYDERQPHYLSEIGIFVKKLLNNPLQSWKDKILKRIEVTTNLEIFMPQSNQKLQEKNTGNMTITVKPDDERSRSWSIWWINDDLTKRTRLFLIQPSQIPNAGYGLFAAQEYKADEILGVYYGDIICLKPTKNTNYTLQVLWPPKQNNSRLYYITPRGASLNLEDAGNVYFAIHMANDPTLAPPSKSSNRTSSRLSAKQPSPFKPNILIREDLSVVALADIKLYEEIFLHYGYEA